MPPSEIHVKAETTGAAEQLAMNKFKENLTDTDTMKIPDCITVTTR